MADAIFDYGNQGLTERVRNGTLPVDDPSQGIKDIRAAQRTAASAEKARIEAEGALDVVTQSEAQPVSEP